MVSVEVVWPRQGHRVWRAPRPATTALFSRALRRPPKYRPVTTSWSLLAYSTRSLRGHAYGPAGHAAPQNPAGNLYPGLDHQPRCDDSLNPRWKVTAITRNRGPRAASRDSFPPAGPGTPRQFALHVNRHLFRPRRTFPPLRNRQESSQRRRQFTSVPWTAGPRWQ